MAPIAHTTRTKIKASVERRLRFSMTAAKTRWTTADVDEAITAALRTLYPLGDDDRIIITLDESGLHFDPNSKINAIRGVVIRDASVPAPGRQETLRPSRWSFYPNQQKWFQLEDGIKPGTDGTLELVLRIIERYNETSEEISADPEAVNLYVLAWLCGQELADGQDSDREMYGRMAVEFRVAADLRRQTLLLMQYPELRPPEKKSSSKS